MNRVALFILACVAASALPVLAQDAKKSAADLSKQIRKSVEAQKEEEALAGVRDLAGLRGPDAQKALFDLGIAVQIPKVYKGITEALAGMTDEEAFKFYEAEAKGSNEVRRIYLADVLSEMKHPKAAELLGVLAEERNTAVLRSTVAALGKLRLKECVEPLLRILERLETAKDRGQVYQETRDAIFAVTSLDFDVMADWKKWWDVAKATFDPEKKPDGATQTRKPVRDAAADFAGRKIFGKNMVFVIDTSGTMQYVMKDDIPGLARADGTDRAGGTQEPDERGTAEDQRLAKFWTRMEMAKRSLIKALEGLDARARVNVLEFNTKVKSMQKTPFALTPEMKKKATDWVKRMKWMPNGNTYTQLAIEEAFGTDRTTTEIYFLSDGIPSKDGVRNDPTGPILEKVEALNRFRKVKIHTFGYDPVSITEGMEHPGLVQANDFLKKLAKSTGGTFTLLKVTDEKPPKTFRTERPVPLPAR